MTPEESAAKNGAVGVVTIASFQQLAAMANPNAFFGGGGRGPALNGPSYQVPKLQQPPACPSVPSVIANVGMTNSIFQGEKMNATQIFYGAGAGTKQDSFELSAEKKLNLNVAIKSEASHGENVVGILEGGDPVRKNEYIVISAHLAQGNVGTAVGHYRRYAELLRGELGVEPSPRVRALFGHGHAPDTRSG